MLSKSAAVRIWCVKHCALYLSYNYYSVGGITNDVRTLNKNVKPDDPDYVPRSVGLHWLKRQQHTTHGVYAINILSARTTDRGETLHSTIASQRRARR